MHIRWNDDIHRESIDPASSNPKCDGAPDLCENKLPDEKYQYRRK
jgi:hypothetical protein